VGGAGGGRRRCDPPPPLPRRRSRAGKTPAVVLVKTPQSQGRLSCSGEARPLPCETRPVRPRHTHQGARRCAHPSTPPSTPRPRPPPQQPSTLPAATESGRRPRPAWRGGARGPALRRLPYGRPPACPASRHWTAPAGPAGPAGPESGWCSRPGYLTPWRRWRTGTSLWRTGNDNLCSGYLTPAVLVTARPVPHWTGGGRVQPPPLPPPPSPPRAAAAGRPAAVLHTRRRTARSADGVAASAAVAAGVGGGGRTAARTGAAGTGARW
jgi:hypothetical protein